MERNLFGYIWRHSKLDQIRILAFVLGSLPFYFFSLELPKRIVNEAIQGNAFENGTTRAPFLQVSVPLPELLGGSQALFAGFELERLPYLYALSGLFLALVLINGAFKYRINLSKGALGERMLRRLRFDLFSLLLRFTPESLRNVKASEAATIIKDEVEPVGGFIGDAFIQPAFLGSQALTALAFILLQNIWLGLMAGSIVLIQAVLIPYLRREQLRLGKQRQIASRRLAGRVGEIVDGMSAVHADGTTAYERAEIGSRLAQLFDIRFKLFKRKFIVKFLNNLLAQVTPFLFYSVGGYFALTGAIDIGQLVAVIAAYRDLPPPIKDLIDWDQQRQDVQIKYDQVMQQFLPERLIPGEVLDAREVGERPFEAVVELRNVRVLDQRGTALLDGVTLDLPPGEHVALIGPPGGGKDTLARLLARQVWDYTGSVSIGGYELTAMPEAVSGRHLGYVGPEPVLFPVSLRENLVYGLKHRPIRKTPRDESEAEARLRILEAERTGNPLDDIRDDWVDYEAAGVADADELDNRLITLLDKLGLSGDIYRFGLSGTLDGQRHPGLPDRMVAARRVLHARLQAENLSRLVEPFDPDRFNANATVGENLLFGVPRDAVFAERNLSRNPFMRRVLAAENLEEPLVRMGLRIAETMIEIFADLPPGHSLFEQFSFISADELPAYEALVARSKTRGRRGGLTPQDREELIQLPLIYVEPRHRLGLIDEAFARRIVTARHRFREELPANLAASVEFYDPDLYCMAAPLRDNLLFGRVAYGVANANERVTSLLSSVVDESGLAEAVMRIGLDFPVGPQGRLLTQQQRAIVGIGRALTKRPDLLIVNEAFGPFDAQQQRKLLAVIRAEIEGRGFIFALEDETLAEGFDRVLRFVEGRIEEAAEEPGAEPAASAESELFREATTLP